MSLTKQLYDDNQNFLESLTNSSRAGNGDLKKRIINIKSKMPSGIVPLFIKVYPEYDTDLKKERLRNVLSCRAVDAEITEKLEKIESKLNQINK